MSDIGETRSKERVWDSDDLVTLHYRAHCTKCIKQSKMEKFSNRNYWI